MWCALNSLGHTFCVRWTPSEDVIASASQDGTAKLLDFKSGKVIYTGKKMGGKF